MAVRKSEKPQPKLPDPLTFSGKSVLVTFQTRTHNIHGAVIGHRPIAGRDEELPIAIITSHFQRCYVEGIAKIIGNQRDWILSDAGLDMPDVTPWFVVCCITAHGVSHKAQYLAVNESFEFYPFVLVQDSPPHFGTHGFPYESCHMQKVETFKDFITYSDIDRLMIESAIQAFLRHKSWIM